MGEEMRGTGELQVKILPSGKTSSVPSTLPGWNVETVLAVEHLAGYDVLCAAGSCVIFPNAPGTGGRRGRRKG